MRLLLDTHARSWSLVDDRWLFATARAAIETTANVTFISAASAWEIVIKTAKGKLRLPPDAEAASE